MRVSSALRYRNSADRLGLALAVDIIHQDVLAEVLRLGEEGAAVVELRDLVDEVGQVIAALQHEGVDRDVVLGAADDLLEGLLDRAVGGRVVEVDAARSEEHTSELQSRQYLVCRLLLEKKKYNLSLYHIAVIPSLNALV